MKSNSCWTFLNNPKAFGSASDWIGQWFIQHPSKLSVSDWIENYRVSQPIPKHCIPTNPHFIEYRNPQTKSNDLPFQHYSSSFHIEFDFTAVILQRSCSGRSCTSWRTPDKYCKSSFAEELEGKHRHSEVRCNLDKSETGTSRPLNECETNNRKNTALPTFESISKQRVINKSVVNLSALIINLKNQFCSHASTVTWKHCSFALLGLWYRPDASKQSP